MEGKDERKMAREFLETQGWHPHRVDGIERYYGDVLEKGRSIVAELDSFDAENSYGVIHHDGFTWFVAVLKARLGLPLDKPATIYEAYSTDGICLYQAGLPPNIKESNESRIEKVDRIVVCPIAEVDSIRRTYEDQFCKGSPQFIAIDDKEYPIAEQAETTWDCQKCSAHNVVYVLVAKTGPTSYAICKSCGYMVPLPSDPQKWPKGFLG